ncbi:hypothetical protein SISSUDRAFT_931230 [Sistotremastrum suecicum HHB10207 ss-3]|uniref:U6 snRNA phosphodiesterase 1 n=1 Tax=Sistotremastrum suecicum HHB10207 ss-3 TaxID=1314776 RepID=A0A166BQJ4_9AGAM|nr:hypothetical protein SISSUDRAFT_931230 [Sistotremastrum suecicum HHB10207 ss-3]
MLSSNLVLPRPIDDPALHQGRVRSIPHVNGQFAAYIFIPVVLHGSTKRFVDNLVTESMALQPGLHDIRTQDRSQLHVSLSRLLLLSASQRDDLKMTLRAIALAFQCFRASFSSFSVLTNDEKTRHFLAMDVGAGHNEFQDLVIALRPGLRAIHQKDFYTEPKFHASFAWTLALDVSNSEEVNSCTSTPPSYLEDLRSTFQERHATTLQTTMTFDVKEIAARIGKDVYRWPLVEASNALF